ncbi:hypothetical protein HS1genome_1497 [Sulfodiicoccus acidiphilus]|uniref:HTH arsR-type domain-containing protein n=1 Tax=Sulfodiicoccus acidiphilus TaxID=1670455 RepID=A0A348B4K6_9CREN|nr:winged helix-turn-helix domain-containing protein [Sulfodiicoccus acidiphilus]BBD73108.1 hypothetical protein HS1genome_1497 [Sulfodiicoccus acidiphilus]GGU00729.1 hypothetical protein GCM10007116_17490 [Sulfodiicoccus acidiphilus]
MGRRLERKTECSTRQYILSLLESGPASAYSLSKVTGLNYCTVRYHLDVLTREGLVVPTRSGQVTLYRKAKVLPSAGVNNW